MHGAPLSRWTMTYFACALGFLVAALVLVVLGFGVPDDLVAAPDVLVVIHLVSIGWLGLLFIGALLQFVPVLAGRPLRLSFLALPALSLILAGLVGLMAGFLVLGDYLTLTIMALSLGASLLLSGLAVIVAMLLATILPSEHWHASPLLIVIGLSMLIVTGGFGLSFATEIASPDVTGWLPSITLGGLSLHAGFGAFGWMTLAAIGVSYRLLAMFMLAPEQRPWGQFTRHLAMTSLALSLATMRLAALCAFFAALSYGIDLLRMVKSRRRKVLEANSLGALIAVPWLLVALALICAALWLPASTRLAVSGFYLLLMGWLSGLGLAQLYKIIPFLTWLQTYGSLMGRRDVPKVQDLVRESHGLSLMIGYHLTVFGGALAVGLGQALMFRVAAGIQLLMVIGLVLELICARRLSYVPPHLRIQTIRTNPRLQPT